MSEFLETVRAEEGRASAALAIAEDIERRARCNADYERRKVLALRQFLYAYTELESLPDMQPAQTEADHPSGDIGDHAAGVPLAPAAAIQESGPSRGSSEAVAPSPDDSAIGRDEASAHALPAAIQNTEAPKPLPEGSPSEPHLETPAEAKTSARGSLLSNDSGEVQDEGAIHLPTHTREESRERQTAGESPVSKPEASIQGPTVEELGATAANGRHEVAPAVIAQIPNDSGPQSDISAGLVITSDPATKPLVRDRVKALHAEHPELTYAEARARLGLSKGALSGHCSILGIKFGAAKAAPVSAQVDDRAEPEGEPAVAAEAEVDPAAEAEPPVVASVYRLMAPSGQWLHRDVNRTTYKIADAWQGGAQDMERLFKGNPRLSVYEAMKA